MGKKNTKKTDSNDKSKAIAHAWLQNYIIDPTTAARMLTAKLANGGCTVEEAKKLCGAYSKEKKNGQSWGTKNRDVKSHFRYLESKNLVVDFHQPTERYRVHA